MTWASAFASGTTEVERATEPAIRPAVATAVIAMALMDLNILNPQRSKRAWDDNTRFDQKFLFLSRFDK